MLRRRYWQCEPSYVCVAEAGNASPVARAATATKPPPPLKQGVVRSPPPAAKRPPPPQQPPQDVHLIQASELLIVQPWGLCGGLGKCGANTTCAGHECANGYSCEFYDELAWQCQPAATPFWAAAATMNEGGRKLKGRWPQHGMAGLCMRPASGLR